MLNDKGGGGVREGDWVGGMYLNVCYEQICMDGWGFEIGGAAGVTWGVAGG